MVNYTLNLSDVTPKNHIIAVILNFELRINISNVTYLCVYDFYQY